MVAHRGHCMKLFVKRCLDCVRPQDVGEVRVVDYLPRRSAYRSGTSPRERSVLQSIS